MFGEERGFIVEYIYVLCCIGREFLKTEIPERKNLCASENYFACFREL